MIIQVSIQHTFRHLSSKVALNLQRRVGRRRRWHRQLNTLVGLGPLVYFEHTWFANRTNDTGGKRLNTRTTDRSRLTKETDRIDRTSSERRKRENPELENWKSLRDFNSWAFQRPRARTCWYLEKFLERPEWIFSIIYICFQQSRLTHQSNCWFIYAW